MTPEWRKSSYSNTDHGECVELAIVRNGIGIRDSKNPTAGHLTVSPAALAAVFAAIDGRPRTDAGAR